MCALATYLRGEEAALMNDGCMSVRECVSVQCCVNTEGGIVGFYSEVMHQPNKRLLINRDKTTVSELLG